MKIIRYEFRLTYFFFKFYFLFCWRRNASISTELRKYNYGVKRQRLELIERTKSFNFQSTSHLVRGFQFMFGDWYIIIRKIFCVFPSLLLRTTTSAVLQEEGTIGFEIVESNIEGGIPSWNAPLASLELVFRHNLEFLDIQK